MTDELIQLEIPFGRDGQLSAEVLEKRTLYHFQPQASLTDIAGALRESFRSPVEFPQLQQACVPGDRVVIALDRATPRADAILVMLWQQLAMSGVAAEDITILQSGSWTPASSVDPRSLLPGEVQQAMQVEIHDPTDTQSCGYLATTAAGDRIYLARRILEADLVIPVGPVKFDPILGHRGEASVIYPAFSNVEAIKRSLGFGHDELSPDDLRPLRQQVDEVGWLLGIQFVVSVIPGRGQGVEQIVVGQSEAVSQKVRTAMQQSSLIEVEERSELVLAAVEADAAGHDWEQIAAVIETARRVVTRDGRIVILSQLNQQRGPGLEILAQARSPEEAGKAIRQAFPPDFLAASRIARAVGWANVYLLSELPAASVEELFMIPLDNVAEAQRLLGGDDSMIIIESAQKVFATCR